MKYPPASERTPKLPQWLRRFTAAGVGFSAALVLWAAASPAQGQDPALIAVNSGGEVGIRLDDGSLYRPDRRYTSGYGAIGGRSFELEHEHKAFLHAVRPGSEMKLHETRRIGPQKYVFDLDDGSYELTVHLAPMTRDGPGLGATTITVDVDTLVVGFDAFAEVGKGRPVSLRGLVRAEGGQLIVDFRDTRGDHDISALAVRGAILNDTSPPTRPDSLTAMDTYGGVLLRWTESPETDFSNYRVYRDTASGWQLIDDDRRIPTMVVEADSSTRYGVVAVDVYGNETPMVPSHHVGPRPPEWSSLPGYELVVDPADLAIIDTDIWADVEVPGDLWLDGVFHGAVQLGYRGNSQRSAPKKSWNIDLDDSPPLGGHSRLILKATFVDPAMERELLFADVLEAGGIPHSRTFPVRLDVNGEYRGVLFDVERIDADFLTRVGWAQEGRLYRVRSTLDVLPSTTIYINKFELANREDWQREDIIELSEGIAYTADADILPWLESQVDVEGMLGLYCHQIWVANQDFLRDDYYLYRGPNRFDRWKMIPWDLHEAWNDPSQDVNFGTRFSRDGVGEYNRLLDRILGVPALNRRYTEMLRTLMQQHLATDPVLQLQVDRTDLMYDDVIRDTRKFSRELPSPYHAELSRLRQFILLRSSDLESQLASYEQPEHVLIHLSELIPANGSIHAIEILNLSNRDFELEDFFLTDSFNDPLQWEITSAMIPAGGRHLVPLPTAVEAGEWIGLYRDRGSVALVDSTEVPSVLHSGRGYGRYPDTSSRWRFLEASSPGAPNAWTSPVQIDAHMPEVLLQPRQLATVTIHGSSEEAWPLGGVVELLLETRDGITLNPNLKARIPITLLPGGQDSVRVSRRVPKGIPANGYRVRARFLRGQDEELARTYQEFFVVGDPSFPWAINEIMAINDGTVADEWGDFDDWLELYNASDRACSTANLYLTDDIDGDPFRWALPVENLGARQRRMIWCDSEPEEGSHHATFKLSGGGEEIGLIEKVGNSAVVRNRWVFGPQVEDQSVGRYPDGNPSWVVLDSPSPMGPNQYTVP